jgi:prepilin signal peptidase PulO-like enzyme (type II secretory pathway)
MNEHVRQVLSWLLLAWGVLAGVFVWIRGKENVKLSAVLVATSYSVILIHGLFFKPREELRKQRLEYIGFAIILAFWLLLTVSVFVK